MASSLDALTADYHRADCLNSAARLQDRCDRLSTQYSEWKRGHTIGFDGNMERLLKDAGIPQDETVGEFVASACSRHVSGKYRDVASSRPRSHLANTLPESSD